MERKLEGMKRDEEGGGCEVHWHRLCCSLFLFVHFPSDRGNSGGDCGEGILEEEAAGNLRMI
jgi:hypothetical protein